VITQGYILMLLAKDEDDIWLIVGQGLDRSLGSNLRPRKTLIEAAKTWFDQNHDSIQKSVCNHSAIIRLLDAQTSDDVAIALGICSILSKEIDPVVAAGVAVLLVKRGLQLFCSGSSTVD